MRLESAPDNRMNVITVILPQLFHNRQMFQQAMKSGAGFGKHSAALPRRWKSSHPFSGLVDDEITVGAQIIIILVIVDFIDLRKSTRITLTERSGVVKFHSIVAAKESDQKKTR